jgi:hypothetical protein
VICGEDVSGDPGLGGNRGRERGRETLARMRAKDNEGKTKMMKKQEDEE